MLRAQKEAVLTELQEDLKNSQSVVLTDYRGLRAGELGRLRHELRAAGIEFHIVKNSLLERALAANGVQLGSDFSAALQGPTAIAYTTADEVTLPMKLVHESSKKMDRLQIKGGLLESQFVPSEQVVELAQLPGRTEMMALIVGALQSPITGIMSALQTIIGDVVSGLDQIAEQKAAESGDGS